MFTWICPKCGGEVPPAYSDCPRRNPPEAKARQTAVREPAAVATPVPAPPAPQPAVHPSPVPVTPRLAEPVAPPPPPASPAFHQASPTIEHPGYGVERPPARTVSPVLAGAAAALGIVALLYVLYIFVLPRNGGSPTASGPDSPSLEKPASASPAAARSGSVNPLAKHIEVAGVRIQERSGGNVRIDFVVVNHSAADLPQLKMDVRLASGNREFFVIPVQIPSLGPYESKDMSTTVKTNLRPYELPDWQMLQPKFTIQD